MKSKKSTATGKKSMKYMKSMTSKKSMKSKRALKKPFMKPTHRHRICATCGRRSDKCECCDTPPVVGSAQPGPFKKLRLFLRTDTRRRFLSDCLDIRLLMEWLTRMFALGMSPHVAFIGIIAFRFFNRVSTFKYLRRAFDSRHASPRWEVLVEDLASATEKLHKAFSRPVTSRDNRGRRIGRDTIENAVLTFKAMFVHPSFRSSVKLLAGRITTATVFVQFDSAMDGLQVGFPGALGPYRRKNIYDVLIASRWIAPAACSSYPVAPHSGTASSLGELYGVKACSRVNLAKLLVHFSHQLKTTRADSLASCSLVLCGWERSKKMCSYEKKRMTMLDRAIIQEEREYSSVIRSMVDEADELD
jgi:hypothetical protein